jgi:hypothetical protein
VEFGELVDALEHEGAAFGCAAEKAGLDAAVLDLWRERATVRWT